MRKIAVKESTKSAIKDLYIQGYSKKHLADKFGLHEATIRKIIKSNELVKE